MNQKQKSTYVYTKQTYIDDTKTKVILTKEQAIQLADALAKETNDSGVALTLFINDRNGPTGTFKSTNIAVVGATGGRGAGPAVKPAYAYTPKPTTQSTEAKIKDFKARIGQ